MKMYIWLNPCEIDIPESGSTVVAVAYNLKQAKEIGLKAIHEETFHGSDAPAELGEPTYIREFPCAYAQAWSE